MVFPAGGQKNGLSQERSREVGKKRFVGGYRFSDTVTGGKVLTPLGVESGAGLLKELVGTARFELATPCTPSKCATRLRYVPT
jgi:hypothetical protein